MNKKKKKPHNWRHRKYSRVLNGRFFLRIFFCFFYSNSDIANKIFTRDVNFVKLLTIKYTSTYAIRYKFKRTALRAVRKEIRSVEYKI